MQQHQDRLDELRIDVAVVTFQGGPLVEAYVRETGCPWPILIDESRELYTAYGMERGRWWEIWGLGSWWAYLKLLLRGRRLHKPAGDVRQLGGDVLIDPEGTVRLHHVGRGPADRPPVESILRRVSDVGRDCRHAS